MAERDRGWGVCLKRRENPVIMLDRIVIKSLFPQILIFLFLYSHSVFSQSNGRYRSFEFQQFEITVLSPYQKIHATQENIDFIQSSIQSELESQGLRLQESPDLFINIKTTIKQEVQPRDPAFIPFQYSVTPYTNIESERKKFVYGKIGTITIELEDAKKNIKVWSGARSIMLWGKNEKTLRKKTNKAIAKIFKKFDPTTIGY